MNGRVLNCVGAVIGSSRCPTKSGDAQRNSSRLKILFLRSSLRGRFRQAAAFDHLAEYQQGIEVEGRVLFHGLFQLCNRVLRFCIYFAHFRSCTVGPRRAS